MVERPRTNRRRVRPSGTLAFWLRARRRDRLDRRLVVLRGVAVMPFGFSMGEIVVTAGAVAVAFGPKDIPVIARGLGKLTGQAVGYVGLMSARMDALARDAKVHDLHAEMKASVSELVGVTDEIRGGLDVRGRAEDPRGPNRLPRGGREEQSPRPEPPEGHFSEHFSPDLTANDAPPSPARVICPSRRIVGSRCATQRTQRGRGGHPRGRPRGAGGGGASGGVHGERGARRGRGGEDFGVKSAGERVIDSSKAGLAGVGVSGGVSPGKEAAR